ncbi:MAG: 2,3-cyclic 3-phosphodiesterase [Solirubrobacterales bacterium]|jgi:2'-5' RNA ligase|nr:2,3-cyclic 3-phosphodiesterase [Solirubrobacterales bacterium]
MASAGEGPKKQRVFVALDLPEPVREGLTAWGKAELVDPALRPTRPESLHLTLVFLGDREPTEVEAIAAVVKRSGAPAPMLKLEDPISLPRRRRASLFALPAPSPAASDLQRGLVERLVTAGLHGRERRDFWPHVTVARVRPEGRGSRRPAAVTRRPGDLPEGLKHAFGSVRLALYRSELQSGGSRYVPLAQVELS